MNPDNRAPVLAELFRDDTVEDADDQSDIGSEHQYLRFLLSGDMYAFNILNVKEILEYGNVTRVPMMPDFIQGVINLRGEVVPVINLARRFQLPASGITKRTCVVIVEVTASDRCQDLGVMVDSVSEVLEFPPRDICPAPQFGACIRTDFIRGMGKLGDDFVILLAEDRVLSVDELARIELLREAPASDSEDRRS